MAKVELVIYTLAGAIMAMLLYYGMTDIREFQKINKVGRERTV